MSSSSVQQASFQSECPVCFEPMSKFSRDTVVERTRQITNSLFGKRSCVTTDCGHSFHGVCAENWWMRNLNCPMCRNPVDVLSALETLRQNDCGISLRSQHFLKAIQSGEEESAVRLLENGPIDESLRIKALRSAERQCQVRLMNELVPFEDRQAARSQWVLKAAEEDNTSLACRILEGEPIENSARNEALQFAVEIGRESVIKALFSNGKIEFFALCKAINKCISRLNMGIFQHLAELSGLNGNDIGRKVIIAACRKDRSRLENFLKEGAIEDRQRAAAFLISVQNKQTEIARILLEDGIIEDVYLMMALVCAGTDENLRFIRILLESRPFSQEFLEKAILAVTHSERGSALERAIANRELSHKKKTKAILENTPAGCKLVVQQILKYYS